MRLMLSGEHLQATCCLEATCCLAGGAVRAAARCINKRHGAVAKRMLMRALQPVRPLLICRLSKGGSFASGTDTAQPGEAVCNEVRFPAGPHLLWKQEVSLLRAAPGATARPGEAARQAQGTLCLLGRHAHRCATGVAWPGRRAGTRW